MHSFTHLHLLNTYSVLDTVVLKIVRQLSSGATVSEVAQSGLTPGQSASRTLKHNSVLSLLGGSSQTFGSLELKH